MDVPPIKVNDRGGNPIMIGLVLVWRIKDTYKACFNIDVETTTQPAASRQGTLSTNSTTVQQQLKGFAQRYFGSSARALVSFLVDNKEVTLDDLEAITKELEK